MYACYREAHPPSAVEHCTYANFYNSKEKNLVVGGTNYITVYRLQEEPLKNVVPTEGPPPSQKARFVQVGHYPLFGSIVALQTVQLFGSQLDSLLVAFKDAKLSLIEYDSDNHDLRTVSLHFFEQEELKEGFQQVVGLPMVCMDPDQRCVAMLIYGRKLIILPFRRDTTSDEFAPPGGLNKVLPSYTIDVRKLDEKVHNVIDIKFLHGYYEPTLLILYEPIQTWSGRVAVRKDTCAIAAISINISQKVHPVIWSHADLPYDCWKAVAIPKPIGGVLLFAVNSLMYLNQSIPPYGVSVNSIADHATEFVLKPMEGLRITLDCAQTSFIANDRLVLSLKDGDLYLLTLLTDGMRSVRSFNFDKAASSVLTSCMAVIEPEYLFLGSRLGNSLLLKYTERSWGDTVAPSEEVVPAAPSSTTTEPPGKKKRLNTAADWAGGDLDELLQLNSADSQTTQRLAYYVFEVCDSLVNIGPCTNIALGEPALLSEELSTSLDPFVELVSTSGYDKNGAVSVLQRTIRPQIISTFELAGCDKMWTVRGAEGSVVTPSPDDGGAEFDSRGSHAHLVINRNETTMILETGQEFMELDRSGYATNQPTVFAGNLGNDRYIVQVNRDSLRLLRGTELVTESPVSDVCHCSLADPYVVMLTSGGGVLIYVLREGDGDPCLDPVPVDLPPNSPISAVSAYRDDSGMFAVRSVGDGTQGERPAPDPPSDTPPSTTTPQTGLSVDDEDELLYGDAEPVFTTEPLDPEPPPQTNTPDPGGDVEGLMTPTYWCCVCTRGGQLLIYTLPDLTHVFTVENFSNGGRVLVNEMTEVDSGSGDPVVRPVRELLVCGLGVDNSRPYVIALLDEELFIYETFPFSQCDPGTLAVRFKKFQHDVVFRERRITKTAKKFGKDKNKVEEEQCQFPKPSLTLFTDVSTYSGVFISGTHPLWIFMTIRGCLRIHHMWIDGPVLSFSSFHNVNCPHGFLYFNNKCELRIAALPPHMNYDSYWPVRKIPIRCTPHFISYHLESKTYSLVTSAKETMTKIPKMVGDEREYETIERGERFVSPTLKRFSLQLITPTTWEIIPNSKIEMNEFEHVTCMKTIHLKSEGSVSGLHGYVVLGTTHPCGEELPCRGRILIYNVIEVVPEPGQPLTKNKYKVIYDKDQKGAVTALAEVSGYLVAAIGQKIFIYSMVREKDLIGVAFIDSTIYVHSIAVVKSFILASDVFKSSALLRFDETNKTLHLVSRDCHALETYSSTFMVDNNQLGFLVSDSEKNLIMFTYQPEARESHGGTRLIWRADFNCGYLVNTFFSIRCKIYDPGLRDQEIRNQQQILEKRQVTFFGTLDGGIAFVLPVTEKIYRRLLMLQNILTAYLNHHAGLNPRACRQLRVKRKLLLNPQHNILDGELIFKYAHLSLGERNEIARKLGTNVDQLLDDITEIERTTHHF